MKYFFEKKNPNFCLNVTPISFITFARSLESHRYLGYPIASKQEDLLALEHFSGDNASNNHQTL